MEGHGEQVRAAREAEAAPAGPETSADRDRAMYDRCSAMAGIGVWQCDLATEALIWTDGVYDLFDLPRGIPITRDFTKAHYDAASCREMERLRSRAIAEGGGFSLDISIVTARGARRWIRITADVERHAGVPVRIFGLKQDVTREKDLFDRLQRLAERDPLTGLANRGLFEAWLASAEAPRPGEPALAAVVLFDVDNFKAVNDTLGHATGDACLKAVADSLAVGPAAVYLAARLGGDEFAVLVYGSPKPAEVEAWALAVVRRNRRMVGCGERRVPISVSAGIALAVGGPAGPAASLVQRADRALYAAKAAGRDTVRTDRTAAGGDAVDAVA